MCKEPLYSVASGPGCPCLRFLFGIGKDLRWHAVQAFSRYQGTKATQLLTVKVKARMQVCLSILFCVLSHAHYYLPFMGFLNSSCWQSRFLSKFNNKHIFFELLFTLSFVFPRQNITYSNCYQVFTGPPPIFQVCLFLM